jgi:type IV pilus assembly protein PilQ
VRKYIGIFIFLMIIGLHDAYSDEGALSKKNLSKTDFISNIDFRQTLSGDAQIIIDFSSPLIEADVQKKGKLLMIYFSKAYLPSRLKREYDVSEFGTAVQFMKASIENSQVVLQVDTRGAYEHMAYQINNQFIIELQTQSSQRITKENKALKFKGKPLSLNFQKIEVRAVLALLADFSGINLVASDSVKGSITLRLNQVPWDQALDLILKTQGLDKRQTGNVTWVAPAEEIAGREKQTLANEEEIKNLAPLQTDILHLRFAQSVDVAKLLKDKTSSLLSSRGNVSVDERTNSLVILDTAAHLNDVRSLVDKLDVPVKQVLIEARIVNVEKDFQSQLGVRFGISKGRQLKGTVSGENDLATKDRSLDGDFSKQLNFDLPASQINTTGMPASMGLALATLGGGYLLDLELSALESEGLSHVISTPRVITSNQHTGYFETGEELPYQTAMSSGATAIAFKKAVLSVGVTPHITPDNKIILDLRVTQDKKGTVTNQALPPPINTNQVETQVLVDNGQTIVLGGFYKEEKINTMERVPFLGELPLIGAMFRHKGTQDKQTELLVFITPKIINESLVA